MRIVCLSDTHNHNGFPVPDGDLLLHAGDFTGRGRPGEVAAFDRFLASLPHRHKVVIAGNHDFLFQDEPERARELLVHATYLQDDGVEVEGLRIWGSPWQPWFYDWAFNLPRGAPIAERWARIPAGTDVLVTHGPPAGVLDRTAAGEGVGCEELARAVARLKPGLHVFGHIHESRGIVANGATLSINASICDSSYQRAHAPVVVDWTPAGPVLVEGD